MQHLLYRHACHGCVQWQAGSSLQLPDRLDMHAAMSRCT
jgi:hypothetical protein